MPGQWISKRGNNVGSGRQFGLQRNNQQRYGKSEGSIGFVSSSKSIHIADSFLIVVGGAWLVDRKMVEIHRKWGGNLGHSVTASRDMVNLRASVDSPYRAGLFILQTAF
jgi:hypothetical protein